MTILLALLVLFSCTGCATKHEPTTAQVPTAAGDPVAAEQALRQGNYGDSSKLYANMIRSGTASPELLNDYGASLVGEGREDEAVDVLTRAISTTPNRGDLYYNRAVALYRLQKYDDAIYDFRKASELLNGPEKAKALIGAGIAFAAKKELELALDYLNDAAKIAPNNTSLLIKRGEVLLDMTLNEPAEKDFTAAIEQSEDNVAAYNNRGISRIHQKRFDEAADDFTRAIEIDPNTSDYYYNRGLARQKAGYFRKAATDYTFAIGREPDNAEAYNNRGLAFMALRLSDEGCRDLAHACKLGICESLDQAQKKGLCP